MHIGEGVINTTSDHPFFVGGRWLRVAELHVGDSVVTYTANKLVISAIDIVVKRTTVHNFEVEDFHTYYVSKQQVLVHNNGPCDVEGQIGKYKDGRKLAKGISDLEVHHLIEKRFKNLFGEKSREMISKILNKANHQEFTNAWRNAIKYGIEGTGEATKESVIKAAKEIYQNHPDILKALEPYFK